MVGFLVHSSFVGLSVCVVACGTAVVCVVKRRRNDHCLNENRRRKDGLSACPLLIYLYTFSLVFLLFCSSFSANEMEEYTLQLSTRTEMSGDWYIQYKHKKETFHRRFVVSKVYSV